VIFSTRPCASGLEVVAIRDGIDEERRRHLIEDGALGPVCRPKPTARCRRPPAEEGAPARVVRDEGRKREETISAMADNPFRRRRSNSGCTCARTALSRRPPRDYSPARQRTGVILEEEPGMPAEASVTAASTTAEPGGTLADDQHLDEMETNSLGKQQRRDDAEHPCKRVGQHREKRQRAPVRPRRGPPLCAGRSRASARWHPSSSHVLLASLGCRDAARRR